MENRYDVFISYSSEDQKVVEGVCGYLERNGYRCFVAYRDIPRGVVWATAITEAIDASAMMVVVFSRSFNISSQTDREIELASENQMPILTYRVVDTEMTGAKKYYLKNLNWIDAFPNPENYFGQLLDSVARLLGLKSLGQTTSAKVQGALSQSQRTTTPISQKPTSGNYSSSNLVVDKYPNAKFILNPKKWYVPLWVWLLLPVLLYALIFVGGTVGMVFPILGICIVMCFKETMPIPQSGAITLWTIGIFIFAFLIGFLLYRWVKKKNNKWLWLFFPLFQSVLTSVACMIYQLPFWCWMVMPVASSTAVFLFRLLIWGIVLLFKKRIDFKRTYFIEQCEGGIARIATREKLGLAKKYLCKVILPVEYDDIARLDTKVFIIEKNGKKGVFVKKKIFIPVQYDRIEVKEDGVFVATKGGVVEYYSPSGVVI